MAKEKRLIKYTIQEARELVEAVSKSAAWGLTSSESDKLGEAISLLFDLEDNIDKIKEEFIKTIDECNL